MKVKLVQKNSLIRIYDHEGKSKLCESIYKKYTYNKKLDCYEYPISVYRSIQHRFSNAKFSDKFNKHIHKLENSELNKKYCHGFDTAGIGLKDIELYDFQKTASNFVTEKFLIGDNKAVYIADEQGLGKTIETITVALRLKFKINRVLVICPFNAKYEWARMINDYTDKSYAIIENISCRNIRAFFTVISYDMYRILKDKGIFDETKFDLLVCDEAHNIKSKDAKRTQAVLEDGFEYKIFLSGTPILNRVAELWTVLHLINPELYNNENKFLKKFCKFKTIRIVRWYGGRRKYIFIPKWYGSKNVPLLRYRLKDIMIRRLKSDVYKELPPKIYQTLSTHLYPKQQKFYDDNIKALRTGIDDGVITKESAASKFHKLRKVCSTLAHFGKQDNSAKLDLMQEQIENLLYGDNKIFIVCYYKHTLRCAYERIKKMKIKCLCTEIDNDMQKMVYKFQNDKKYKIFFGTIGKVKESITLTAANYMIRLEKVLVQKYNEQVEDRLHRIGQHNSVTIIDIIVKDSIEERINNEILLPKKELFDRVIEGRKTRSVNLDLKTIRRMIK